MGNHGLKLKEIRRAAGLTQRALAQLAIVSRGTISHVEHGRYAPTPKFAGKICRGLSRSLGLELDPATVFPETFLRSVRLLAGNSPAAS